VSQRRKAPAPRRAAHDPAAASPRPAAGRQAPSQPDTATHRGSVGPAPAAPQSRLYRAAGRASGVTAEWLPAVSRVLLGLVLAWFGYHELVRPGQWTGYVPVVPSGSSLAIVLVLAHGWVLLVLAVALAAGITPRAAAAAAAVLLLEIVISLVVTGGLSDLTLRDVGVLGLAVCLTGCRQHRLVLRG
jgi:uncharacterized membrane protein YphA (DoxX/SURF4 family)